MINKDLPDDFRPQEYLSLNPDIRLAGIDPKKHYIEFGRKEGRLYNFDHTPRNRTEFFARLQNFSRILEIGPFDRPIAPQYCKPGSNIEYADLLGTDDLVLRAQ